MHLLLCQFLLISVTFTLVVPPETERVTVGTMRDSAACNGDWVEVKGLIPGAVTVSL
jgi:hypothetical protein